MAFAQVGGIALYYETHGMGQPLVLVTGMATNMEGWRSQIDVYSPEFRVIAFDHRGTGRSDKPDEPYSIALFAADTIGLLDALHIDKAHFYGISMGSLVAQEIGLSYPERVRSLILGCSTPGGRQSIPMPAESREVLSRTAQASPEEAAEMVLPLAYTGKFIESHREEIRERSKKSQQYPTPPFAAKRHFEAAMHFNAYSRLPRLPMPVLIIAGREDVVIPARNSEILAELIPRSELVLLDNAGHGYSFEAAGPANAAILDFLRRHR